MRIPATLSLMTAMAIAGCQPRTDAPAASVDAASSASARSSPAPRPLEPQASVPEGLDMGPVEVPETDPSCRATLGEAASARLVERCVAVSPATRPPCNAANACDRIQGEIDRSCAMYGPDETRPTECAV